MLSRISLVAHNDGSLVYCTQLLEPLSTAPSSKSVHAVAAGVAGGGGAGGTLGGTGAASCAAQPTSIFTLFWCDATLKSAVLAQLQNSKNINSKQ